MLGYAIELGHVIAAAVGTAGAIGAVALVRHMKKNPVEHKNGLAGVFDSIRGAKCGSEKMDVRFETTTESVLRPGSFGPIPEQVRCPDVDEDVGRQHEATEQMEEDVQVDVSINRQGGEEVKVDLMGCVNRNGLSADLVKFLEVRCAEISQMAVGDSVWCENIVDFYDELTGESLKLDSQSDAEITKLRLAIEKLLNEQAIELLRYQEWTPECQKAVVVTPSDGCDRIRIVQTITSGIKKDGKILRKQEVSVITPKKGEKQ